MNGRVEWYVWPLGAAFACFGGIALFRAHLVWRFFERIYETLPRWIEFATGWWLLRLLPVQARLMAIRLFGLFSLLVGALLLLVGLGGATLAEEILWRLSG